MRFRRQSPAQNRTAQSSGQLPLDYPSRSPAENPQATSNSRPTKFCTGHAFARSIRVPAAPTFHMGSFMTIAACRHALFCGALLCLLPLTAMGDEEVDLAPPVDLEAPAATPQAAGNPVAVPQPPTPQPPLPQPPIPQPTAPGVQPFVPQPMPRPALQPVPDPAMQYGPMIPGPVAGSVDQPVAVQLRGTLGFTYLRVSHPVPEEKHPRLGMLAIRTGDNEETLAVRGMSGIRLKSGVWLFESNRPLDPGVSHIVRVEAKEHPMDMDAVATRFVRLIPGRIVYLSFGDTME